MKKFDSVYMLELRLLIYKYLLLFAAMTCAYIVLFITKGLKYAGFGYDIVVRFSRIDRVARVSFVAALVLFAVGSIYYYHRSAYRFKLLRISFAERMAISILVAFTLLFLWYAVTIADIFLVTWLFVKNPAYTGGTQGVNFSFIVSDILRFLVPFRQPILFLRNVGILAMTSIGVNIPCVFFNLVASLESIGSEGMQAPATQTDGAFADRPEIVTKRDEITAKIEKKSLNSTDILIPGDSTKILIPIYAVLMLILTGYISARTYFMRFEPYIYYIGDTATERLRVRGAGWSESYFSKAIDDVFVGSTIFILFCILMIGRNYYYFWKDSKSIYLMKRIGDAGELHRRCLTIPVAAILINLALTFALLYIYYLFYMYNIEVNNNFNLWEVFL